MIQSLKTLPHNLLEYSNTGKLIILDNPDVIYFLKEGDFNLFLIEFDSKHQAKHRMYYGSLPTALHCSILSDDDFKPRLLKSLHTNRLAERVRLHLAW